METQKEHRRALGGVNLLARDTPGRRTEVQASVGATLRPSMLVGFSKLVGFRDLRSSSSHEIRSLKTHPKPTFFLLARVLPGCVWGAQRGILEQKLMTGTPFLVTCYTPTRALVEVNPVCNRIPMNPTRSFGQQ